MIHVHYGMLFEVRKIELIKLAGKWPELAKIILSEAIQIQKNEHCKVSFNRESELQICRCEYII